ncbi:MAG: NUDIX domain-containing protein [Anaerolineaceae bacterium]
MSPHDRQVDPLSPGSSRENPRPRPAARVILIDAEERVLLFRATLPGQRQAGNDGAAWITPGGGVNAGETWEEAARRELWEETGLEDFDVGPCAWLREHTFYFHPAGLWYHQQERYFVSRIASHTVVTDNQEEIEAQFMTAHRWWTLAEMRETGERLVPGNFADLFGSLLTEGPPGEPFQVGL